MYLNWRQVLERMLHLFKKNDVIENLTSGHETDIVPLNIPDLTLTSIPRKPVLKKTTNLPHNKNYLL